MGEPRKYTFEKYFDKRGILNSHLLKNILSEEREIIENYFIDAKLNEIQNIKTDIRSKVSFYLNHYTKGDLLCKGNNCNKMVNLANSRPGSFCSLSCKKGSSYLSNIGKEKFSDASRYKQTETKLRKLYGENAKYLLDKELFIKEFLVEKGGEYIIDYLEVQNRLKISKQIVQKYLRKFKISVKTQYKIPETEKKVKYLLDNTNDLLVKNFNIFTGTRKVLDNKTELDFYIPEYKFAIEVNGIYWHSYGQVNHTKHPKEFYRDRHFIKVNEAEKKDIHLFQINEDEINHIPGIWQSKINAKFGSYEKRYYARKLKVRLVPSHIARSFLNENHLQGFSYSKIKLGLYSEDELLAMMTFGKPRFNKEYEYELIRFCSKLNIQIIGGASKLFKYFIRNYNPSSVISYGNRRWVFSKNNIYSKLGFRFIEITNPSYYYYKITKWRTKPIHRSQFQKHKLKNLEEFKENYSDDLTEEEIVLKTGYRKMFDAGHLKYIWTKEN